MTATQEKTEIQEILTALFRTPGSTTVTMAAPKHFTPEGQSLIQHVHDLVAAGGAVCRADNARPEDAGATGGAVRIRVKNTHFGKSPPIVSKNVT